MGSLILNDVFIEVILAKAKDSLARDGVLVPMVFVRYKSGQNAIHPLELPETNDETVAYFRQLGAFLHHDGNALEEALLVSEVWFANAPEAPDALKAQPGKPPKRIRAIAIVGRNRDGSHTVRMVRPFSRGRGNKLVWKKPSLAIYTQPTDKGLTSTGLLDYLFT